MLGVCYYPEHWPRERWSEDARRMRELGLAYVRVGEFAWALLEPEPGRLDWAWLDEAVAVLAQAGLKVVLGTPTATPPKWLVDRYPEILPVDREGRRRRFGGRRHYCFSSPVYHEETRRIVTLLGERYGKHPAVAGFQTDNEYGCHGTVRCYCERCQDAFRKWLEERYGSIDVLNEAWGTVFWSQRYRTFQEVELPNLTVAEANPSHLLDYYRFASEQVRRYNRLQVEILRAHAPGKFVTHNFMGFFTDLNPFPLGEDLDFASWDSYPLGFTDLMPLPEEEKLRYARTGHPDVAAFHHDLYRAVGRGRFWVMEQQPGPVNWAPHNPNPAPGMVRLWTWEALAHGAEVVSYFRWRQVPFAQEQMHAGLHRPDYAPDAAFFEVQRVVEELGALSLPPPGQAPVALVYDPEAPWVYEVQPHGAEWNYLALVFLFYSVARRLGLDVDIVPPGAALQGYRLVLVPSLPIVREKALNAFREADGIVLFGPRSGSKNENFHIPQGLPPGPLQALLPLKVVRVESLPPGLREEVEGPWGRFSSGLWREWVETDLSPLLRFADGLGALFRAGRYLYLAAWPSPELLGALLVGLAQEGGLSPKPLPSGLRLRWRGHLVFAFNYGPEEVVLPVPSGVRFRLGGPRLSPYEVAVWEEG
ncbi:MULTISPECIES: beta-galactosidase [Thermus]|jgi:beta-galactosidase|uniref:Beta-galactosidase n=2 Tax=Thermus brockianus TaxID=56956 RepID=A0ABM7XL19_THEBO|nr:beta-galactosidase [Thermus brockianus]BDG17031.1 beta-galactosidase [Thermus brockianus]